MNIKDREEYNAKLQKRAEQVILDYELIQDDELVAVALSGGKDSVLTLHILKNFQKTAKFDFELQTIAINEGISGYREEGLRAAQKHSQTLGVPYHEISLQKELGLTLDEAAPLYSTACIPCGVFRRYLLNRHAYKMGAHKLATGHNLDDEVQSFLMSFARADIRRFNKFGPKLNRIHPKMVPRIKPLWKITEKEVGLWAVWNDMQIHLVECPYAHTSLRSHLKSYLNKLEEEKPGTKQNILQSFQKSLKIKPAQDIVILECEQCGEPSSSQLCKACEILAEIKRFPISK